MNAFPARRRYRCADGAYVRIACESEEQWGALARCVGRPELAYEGAWEAVRMSPADGGVAHVLEEMFAEDAAEVWVRRLEAHGVPCEVESGEADAGHPTPDLY